VLALVKGVLAKWRFLTILLDVIEKIRHDEVKDIKSQIADKVKAAGESVLTAATQEVAGAERRAGAEGSATMELKTASRAKKITRELAKWVPIVGAFLR